MIQGGDPNTKDPKGSRGGHGTGGPGYNDQGRVQRHAAQARRPLHGPLVTIPTARARSSSSASRTPPSSTASTPPSAAWCAACEVADQIVTAPRRRARQPERARRDEGARRPVRIVRGRRSGLAGQVETEIKLRMPGPGPARDAVARLGAAPGPPAAPRGQPPARRRPRPPWWGRAGRCGSGAPRRPRCLTFKGPRRDREGVKSRPEVEVEVTPSEADALAGHPARGRLPAGLPLPEVPRDVPAGRPGDRGGRDAHRHVPGDRGRRRSGSTPPPPRLGYGPADYITDSYAGLFFASGGKGDMVFPREGHGARRGPGPAHAAADRSQGQARPAGAQPAAAALDARSPRAPRRHRRGRQPPSPSPDRRARPWGTGATSACG